MDFRWIRSGWLLPMIAAIMIPCLCLKMRHVWNRWKCKLGQCPILRQTHSWKVGISWCTACCDGDMSMTSMGTWPSMILNGAPPVSTKMACWKMMETGPLISDFPSYKPPFSAGICSGFSSHVGDDTPPGMNLPEIELAQALLMSPLHLGSIVNVRNRFRPVHWLGSTVYPQGLPRNYGWVESCLVGDFVLLGSVWY